MKAKLNLDSQYSSNPFPYGLRIDKEYDILGYGKWFVYLINESNQFVRLSISFFLITDNSIPSFWREDPEIEGNFMPEEWHINKFKWQFQEGDLDDIYFELTQNNELWIQTQFAKGCKYYEFEKLPIEFQFGLNDQYKVNIIDAYLKLLSDIDTDKDHILWEYRFGNFSNLIDRDTIAWSNEKPVVHKDQVLTTDKGFDCLNAMLNELIFSNLLDVKNEYTRNRVLFTIWSVFGCFDFSIIKRTFSPGSQIYYILKKDEKVYCLSIEYFT